MALTARRGMTLLELIVTMALSSLILALLVSLFILARRSSAATMASYFLSKETETALYYLRRDLQQSALPSITSYPQTGPGAAAEAPGMSLATALDPDDIGKVRINDKGYPEWGNYVFYTVTREGSGPTGSLVRWVQRGASPNPIPEPTSILPSTLQSPSRVVLRQVLLPQQTLPGLQASTRTDQYGGFRLSFVRTPKAGMAVVRFHLSGINVPGSPPGGSSDAALISGDSACLTQVNPQRVTEGKIAGADASANTRLVEVELKVANPSETGQVGYFALEFRVCPRY